jgi:dienelactone hydrolase
MVSRVGRTFSFAFGLAVATATFAPNPVDVQVPAADGARLTSTYSSPGKPGPGILLLHQCDMDRRAWASLESALVDRGVHVLSPEYRGVGDNRAIPVDYGKRLSDADAALAFLAAQPGVDAAHLAIGGASCGVDLAVQLAMSSRRARALLLLSGATSDDALAWVQHSALPVFFAFSADEGGPLLRMQAALGSSTGQATTIRALQHAGHGVPMFSAEPRLLGEMADWIAARLR